MPFDRLLKESSFDPQHLEAMTAAYEAVCSELACDDPMLRELVAEKIIQFAQRGQRDAQRLHDTVLSAIKM